MSQRIAEQKIPELGPTQGHVRLGRPKDVKVGWFLGRIHGEDHPHKEITQAISGAAIRIQRALGPGLLEDASKVCLTHALRQDGPKVLREVYLDSEWEGLRVERAWRMDLGVDDKVGVEAKTVDELVAVFFAQVNTSFVSVASRLACG